MKFAMVYSCGKDSTLALHKMIEQGHEAVCLVVMVNKEADRSYFHGADRAMLDRYTNALGLPMLTCPSDGEDYHLVLEDGLKRAKGMGAEGAAFGDIDIEGNRQWEENRCEAVGLLSYFPLWQHGREENVYELMELGYRCIIKSVDTSLLPLELLGKFIAPDTVAVMRAAGIDICGENGEYHTLAVDGPVFHSPVPYQLGREMILEHHAVIEIC